MVILAKGSITARNFGLGLGLVTAAVIFVVVVGALVVIMGDLLAVGDDEVAPIMGDDGDVAVAVVVIGRADVGVGSTADAKR